jgi:hypothetical protein
MGNSTSALGEDGKAAFLLCLEPALAESGASYLSLKRAAKQSLGREPTAAEKSLMTHEVERVATNERARQQALRVGDVQFYMPLSLLPRPSGKHDLESFKRMMESFGGYELTQPMKIVNGRPVWQSYANPWMFVFFASNGRWYISDGADMRAGKPRGWVSSSAVEPEALTPDAVKRGWQLAGQGMHGELAGKIAVRQVHSAAVLAAAVVG